MMVTVTDRRVYVEKPGLTAPVLFRVKWLVGVWDRPGEPDGGGGSTIAGYFIRKADARRFAAELRAAGVAGVFVQVTDASEYITDRGGVREWTTEELAA